MRLGLLALLISSALLASPLGAQARLKISDHSFEREVVIDEQGLQQWSPWDVPCTECKRVKETECLLCKGRDVTHCIECEGDQRATCRACLGTARLPDPMVATACAICLGAGVYPCAQCAGAGYFGVNTSDGGTRKESCRGCKQSGGFECRPCAGTGLLQTVQVKKKPIAEAKPKDVLALRDLLRETLAALEAFEHDATGRKTEKAFAKLMKDSGKRYPALADMVVMLKEVNKSFAKVGPAYDNYEGKLTHQFYTFQDRTVWLLRRQLLVLDLEIARSQFNESVALPR